MRVWDMESGRAKLCVRNPATARATPKGRASLALQLPVAMGPVQSLAPTCRAWDKGLRATQNNNHPIQEYECPPASGLGSCAWLSPSPGCGDFPSFPQEGAPFGAGPMASLAPPEVAPGAIGLLHIPGIVH